MDENQAILKSENKSDLVSQTKTIYNAGAGEIFWKNFLAGLSRGMGTIFVYILFLIVMGALFVNVALPKLMPIITSYSDIFKSIESISNTKPASGVTLPPNIDLQKLLGQ